MRVVGFLNGASPEGYAQNVSAFRDGLKQGVEATSKAMLPYLEVLILGVLVVAFVSWVTFAVPHLLRGR